MVRLAPTTPCSPAKIESVEEKHVCGTPDEMHVSTSYVECANLAIRMNRRFTRLTNAFSKEIENHMHAFALFAMHYNFCKLHKTIHITPAMDAGISDHAWEIEELVALIG